MLGILTHRILAHLQITVYRNGEWAGAEPVAVPRAVCASADPTASPAFVCGAIGLAGGNCTVSRSTSRS